jgi:predicted RNA-binding protein YlxR (DUF448 family)
VRRGHVPLRTCAGCRAHAAKTAMLRVVRTPAGAVVVDPTGEAPGRGAYVHRAPACIEAALARGGLARALRAGVGADAAGRLRAFGSGAFGSGE